jgi:hypothetical protein
MENKARLLRKEWSFSAVLAVSMILTTGCSDREKPRILFEDVTVASGLETYHGMTFGASWGDFDGDGLPDLYVTNHEDRTGAKLYRNLGNGHFADVTDKFFSPQDLGGDMHGAAWADINNDGKEDLMQLTGARRGVGSEPKRFFINSGTHFLEEGGPWGISNPFSRARMPLWVDLNRDGRLDLIEGADKRLDDLSPPFVFIQENGKFTALADTLRFPSRQAPFCILTALNIDNHIDLVCRVTAKNQTALIVDIEKLPGRELKGLLPPSAFEDIAAADFDNDGLIDLYLARKNPPGTVAFGRPGMNEFIADIWSDQTNVGKSAGFSFRSTGQLTVQVLSAWPPDGLSPEQIHIGNKDVHPNKLAFNLSHETAGIAGFTQSEPGKQVGIYVGQTSPDNWEVRFTAPREANASGKSKSREIQIKVASSDAITELHEIGGPQEVEEAPARLFMNRAGKLIEESDKRGVNARLVGGVNVVAGDFDNDMHVDLFVVATNEIGKQENLLLLNRGDGHFDVVSNAGGAAGSLAGVGDSVTTVDYDRDGFLDLLVTTGGSMGRSEGLPSDGGSYHLYHNISNGNHWIEIDLEGTKSNRDGIGALVYVTAGGVTQLRVQDGGMHDRGQNSQRLHFGLAKFTQIDKISVHWPSGVVQELRGVKADQIMRIKEEGQPAPRERSNG